MCLVELAWQHRVGPMSMTTAKQSCTNIFRRNVRWHQQTVKWHVINHWVIFLSCILSDILYLTFCLAFFLTFFLASWSPARPTALRLSPVAAQQAHSAQTLAGWSPARAHSAQTLAGWSRARPTALRLPQRSDSRRLKSGEAHSAQTLAGWSPARSTAIARWQLGPGKAHRSRAGTGGPARPTVLQSWQRRSSQGHCDQELAEVVRRGPARSRGGRWGLARRRRKEDIKSNNPHLAGGGTAQNPLKYVKLRPHKLNQVNAIWGGPSIRTFCTGHVSSFWCHCVQPHSIWFNLQLTSWASAVSERSLLRRQLAMTSWPQLVARSTMGVSITQHTKKILECSCHRIRTSEMGPRMYQVYQKQSHCPPTSNTFGILSYFVASLKLWWTQLLIDGFWFVLCQAISSKLHTAVSLRWRCSLKVSLSYCSLASFGIKISHFCDLKRDIFGCGADFLHS